MGEMQNEIMRYTKNKPSASSKTLRNDLNLSVSSLTIRRRLIESNLKAGSSQRVPVVMSVYEYVAARIKFAKTK